MYKDTKMPKRNQTRNERTVAGNSLPELPDLRLTKYAPKDYKPKNKAQESYINKVENNAITFCIGPAGTGKTFCAAIAAANAWRAKSIDKIIITRPLVEAGEKVGFLPGDLNEKVDPYVAPFVDALKRVLGSGAVQALIDHEKIVFLPLGFMRGHSWDNSFVILDEAQNVTKSQMKLFLTRIGKGTKVIVDGDISQKDIEAYGLEDALDRLARVRGVAIQTFTDADIVRSGIVRDIIRAYSDNLPEEPFEDEEDKEGLHRFLG